MTDKSRRLVSASCAPGHIAYQFASGKTTVIKYDFNGHPVSNRETTVFIDRFLDKYDLSPVRTTVQVSLPTGMSIRKQRTHAALVFNGD